MSLPSTSPRWNHKQRNHSWTHVHSSGSWLSSLCWGDRHGMQKRHWDIQECLQCNWHRGPSDTCEHLSHVWSGRDAGVGDTEGIIIQSQAEMDTLRHSPEGKVTRRGQHTGTRHAAHKLVTWHIVWPCELHPPPLPPKGGALSEKRHPFQRSLRAYISAS